MKTGRVYQSVDSPFDFMEKSQQVPSKMEKPGEQVKVPKLLGSCRLNLTILCFFAVIHIFYVRFNFSMALVCMTGTNVNETESHQAVEGEFDWDRAIVGGLLGSFFYGYILTQVLGGWITDRFGTKMALLFGMMSMSVTSLLMPVAARLHHGALFANRLCQGLVSGFTFPVVYNIFPKWCAPQEKATLMAIAFSGISVANIANFPLSSLLCFSGIDNGWPLIFYVPGATAFIWCIVFYLVTTDSPEDHPRISTEERTYLKYHSCRNRNQALGTNKKDLAVPWKDLLLSIPVHALWITHLCSAWVFYLIALNLPLFINETFDLGIVYNGLLCGIPYIGVFIASFSGKLFDVLYNTGKWSLNALRKAFNTIGFIGLALLLCALPYFPTSVDQIIILSLAASVVQLVGSTGFFISHSDLAGRYSGLLFGMTNTMAQIPGVVNPLLIAILVPTGAKEEWYSMFYLASFVATLGALVYLFFGSNELQHWAGGVAKKSAKLPTPP